MGFFPKKDWESGKTDAEGAEVLRERGEKLVGVLRMFAWIALPTRSLGVGYVYQRRGLVELL